MALGSTQPLTEMSTRTLPGGKWWLVRKADNLISVCKPIVYKMWDPPWPVTGIGLPFFYLTMLPVAQTTYHELMGWIVNWKVDAGKRPWHDLRYYPICLFRESEGSHEMSCQHSWSTVQDLTPGLQKYEAGGLPTTGHQYYYYYYYYYY
jgi:hypothetical protein